MVKSIRPSIYRSGVHRSALAVVLDYKPGRKQYPSFDNLKTSEIAKARLVEVTVDET